MATAEVFDQARAEAFAGQMLGVLNGASLAAMASIGHQTGLFDTMATLPAATCEHIAAAAGLNERYVREWLGAMVTGKIVDYDPAVKTYSLPAEHATCLTRAAGPDNLAFFTQYFSLMGQVEQQVVESFRNGGGVPYSAYPRFQELQAEETARVYDATLIDVTLPLVPGLVERLQDGIEVLDIGCGGGHAVNLMARAFPRSTFRGYDMSEEGVAAARAEAQRWGLSNAHFDVKDVATLDETERYGLITAYDVIHDLAQPAKVLGAVAAALHPDGTFLMIDIAASSNLEENLDHPLGPTLYTFSVTHCMTVSLAQHGAGLGTVWGEQTARRMLADAGFTQVEVKQVPGDILNNYDIATR
ncbi:MAG TPA: class I SAM-dependent methyltransferase [Herpetosiphonaceae bacterium]|nr:class I SAM-dependent methyltransferase [Herpetosiphonaceae bacterium]